MRISVQPLPDPRQMATTAVVVDALRATSVISVALGAGAKQIVVCSEIDDARALAQAFNFTSPSPALLCGERHCQPIPGFDLGNSPQEYSSLVVGGRTLMMTTTNGTRAIAAAQDCLQVFAGAFVNLSALARRLESVDELTIVCAGTDGQVTEEDVLFAGALVHRLSQIHSVHELDEPARVAHQQWQQFLSSKRLLADVLAETRGGRNLVNVGFRADIDVCATIDRCQAVPQLVAKQPLTLTSMMS